MPRQYNTAEWPKIAPVRFWASILTGRDDGDVRQLESPIRSGVLPIVQVGPRRRLILREDFERWLESLRAPQTAEFSRSKVVRKANRLLERERASA